MGDPTDTKPDQAAEKPQEKKEKQPKAPKQPKQPKENKPKQSEVAVVGGKKPGAEIIGVTVSKDVNFAQWYQELVIKAELIEYYSEVSMGQSLRICAHGSCFPQSC